MLKTPQKLKEEWKNNIHSQYLKLLTSIGLLHILLVPLSFQRARGHLGLVQIHNGHRTSIHGILLHISRYITKTETHIVWAHHLVPLKHVLLDKELPIWHAHHLIGIMTHHKWRAPLLKRGSKILGLELIQQVHLKLWIALELCCQQLENTQLIILCHGLEIRVHGMEIVQVCPVQIAQMDILAIEIRIK